MAFVAGLCRRPGCGQPVSHPKWALCRLHNGFQHTLTPADNKALVALMQARPNWPTRRTSLIQAR